MSGGNCAETPRQKMIGMMYLFLTAMLAVNVSSTVLEGFVMVDRSLQTNNEIFKSNNTASYEQFKVEKEKNELKYGEAWELAKELRTKTDKMCASIDSTRWFLARKSDGEEGNPNHLKAMDKVEVASEAMLFAVPGKETKANILKAEIDSYHSFIVDTIIRDKEKFGNLTKAIHMSLNTDDVVFDNPSGKMTKTWAESLFQNIPIGAVMPLLTKIQSDLRNTEAMAIAHLFGQVGATDFSINKLESHLILDSKYLIKGGIQNGMVLLGGIDTTKRPEYNVFINGKGISVAQDGSFSYPASQSGQYEITGNLKLENEDGEVSTYDFNSQKFEVSELSATVSATKMNVLYAGVDNPMSISVPGFSSKNVKARFSDGSQLKLDKNGNYVAIPKTPNKTIAMIVSTMIDDKEQIVGKYPFRVKMLPSPAAFVQYPKQTKNADNKTIEIKESFPGGAIKKSDLLKAYGLVAELSDSDFEVNYKIQGFDITFYDSMGNARTYKSSNYKFTAEQTGRIRALSRGKKFFISNIKAVGPDGIDRPLSPIEIIIN